MLSSNIFISLLAPIAVSAIAVPAQSGKVNLTELTGSKVLENGIYHLTFDEVNGSPFYHFTPTPNTTNTPGRDLTLPHELVGRDAGCDNIHLDSRQTDIANDGLQRTCGGGYFGTTWVVEGDAVAFYCQYDRSAVCTYQSSREANKWITQKCGLYWAGSYTGRGYAYGYTNWRLHDFCNMVIS
ncbi:hypothetical protein PG987_010117 [Apiospora arundinis]